MTLLVCQARVPIEARFGKRASERRESDVGLDQEGLFVMIGLRALTLLFLVFCSTCATTSAADRKPNIVFILADDLGWRDLSNEGSRFYESRNIDRVAREGMKFTRGYATCQVCSPSRASILTGKYPTKHGGRILDRGPIGRGFAGRQSA